MKSILNVFIQKRQKNENKELENLKETRRFFIFDTKKSPFKQGQVVCCMMISQRLVDLFDTKAFIELTKDEFKIVRGKTKSEHCFVQRI